MDKMFTWPPSWSMLFLLPALLLGFTVHELAHALVAYLLGDTSQIERKRLSLNPLRHVSWLGMVAFLLIGIGWAKPVMVDWSRFRIKNRALGMFTVSIAGAAANFLLAAMTLIGMLATIMIVWLTNGVQPVDVMVAMTVREPGPDAMGVAIALSTYVLNVNLLLGLFNLLPLPPLDGFQALMSLITMVRQAWKGRSVPAVAPVAGPAALATASLTGGVAVPPAGREEPPPSPAHIHFGIALAYQKAGELDEAIARYRQAIAHDDQFGLAYYNLGLAYLAKGRQPLAASAFKAALNAHGDTGVQVEASRRLRELNQAEQVPGAQVAPPPAPLELGGTHDIAADRGTPLDPALARRLWLRLVIGGVVALLLGAAAWVFVTMVMLGTIT